MKMHRMQVSHLDRRAKARAQEQGMSLAAYVRALIERDLGMNPTGELNDVNDPPNLNTGAPWNDVEEHDIAYGARHGSSIEELAEFLCRTKREIAGKARGMGLEIPMWKNRRG